MTATAMSRDTPVLDAAGLTQFNALRPAAIDAVTARFFSVHGSLYERFGQRGRDACREDLGYHLEFLRPVLEFGMVQPMVDYLRWLSGVLATRDVPLQHLPQSLDWLGEFFAASQEAPSGPAVATALSEVKARFLEAGKPSEAFPAKMPERWPECDAFEAALLGGHRRAAAALFEQSLARGHSLVDTEMHLVQPALYGIGLKWQNNEVSVAQEHLSTAIAQSLMTQGLLKAELPPPNGRRVLLACVEGNTHALGLQMVSDAFQLGGWDVQFLGASVPTGAVTQQVNRFQPHLLGLSVSFAHQLRTVKEVIARLAQSQGAMRPAIIIGGLAINQFDRLAGQLGADAWSPDARSAVASAATLALPVDLR